MPYPACDKKCHNHDYGVYYVICLKSIVHCPEYYFVYQSLGRNVISPCIRILLPGLQSGGMGFRY